jgi:hypothetical protein
MKVLVIDSRPYLFKFSIQDIFLLNSCKSLEFAFNLAEKTIKNDIYSLALKEYSKEFLETFLKSVYLDSIGTYLDGSTIENEFDELLKMTVGEMGLTYDSFLNMSIVEVFVAYQGYLHKKYGEECGASDVAEGTVQERIETFAALGIGLV